MSHLLIIATALAFAAVTPFMSAPPRSGADAPCSSEVEEATQPGEAEPDG